eukprot:3960123-Amphidinium_carterae.1
MAPRFKAEFPQLVQYVGNQALPPSLPLAQTGLLALRGGNPEKYIIHFCAPKNQRTQPKKCRTRLCSRKRSSL